MTVPEPAESLDPLDPDEPGDPHDPHDPQAGDEDDGALAPEEPDEPRRYPSTIGGAFYLVLLIAALASIGIVVAGDWRVGVRGLGICLGSAALLRLVLPERDAGMLAVRNRAVDVLMLAGVAGVLWWLAGSIPDQPPV